MSKRFSRPINLFSGLLGHGKTLMLMTYAIEARAEGQQLFQLGINGADPAIAPVWRPDESFSVELLEDVESAEGRAERLRAFERWRELPEGSILLVDEIQDYLPVRSPGKPPEWIAELAKLRHRGVQLWATTQDPRNIDAFVRRLICDHVHIERKGGLSGAVTFRWERCAPDPTDWHARKNAVKGAFKYDKSVFGSYKSSAQHLVKRQIPWQVWGTVAAVVVAVVAIFFAARLFLGHGALGKSTAFAHVDSGAHSSGVAPVAPGSVVLPKVGSSGGVSLVGLSTADYLAAFVPRVPGRPWTAPVFDDRRVASEPDVYCVVSDAVGCRCYTEQITRLSGVPDYQCRLMASQGVYNPFREPRRVVEAERSVHSSGDREAQVEASGSSPSASSVDSPWPSRPDFSYRVPFPKASPLSTAGGR